MKCEPGRLKELSPLDLGKCETVDDIVRGMCKCSFGARCLGEICDTIEHIIKRSNRSVIIYDGDMAGELGKLILDFSRKYSFELMTADEFSRSAKPDNLLVLGRFSEASEKAIYAGAKFNTIFINKERLAMPGQFRDGYFPNVLFTEPSFAMPIIYASMDERLSKKKMTTTELVKYLGRFGGLAAEASAGAMNFSRMANDPDYTVFMTMSGAMTIAQMSYVLCDMIDLGMVQSLTTTGAAMAHGLVESMGLCHYKYDPKVPDTVLAKRKLNRVTDTLEPETNFDHIEEIVSAVLDKMPKDGKVSPSEFHAAIGKHLSQKYPSERGILKSAYEKKVPVFVPAFFDSEIGNDVTTYNVLSKAVGKGQLELDLESENHRLIRMVQMAKKTGLFTVGGGVPRNWTQNVAPLIEVMNCRTELDLVEKPFCSGVRISPDAMDLGHLSGCTYSEGMTWRKMDPKGSFVEIHGDATYVWPFIVKYAMENLPEGGIKKNVKF
jgi:deoxyhypusine synthase